ncbi:helix-turn-helix domain-containing protein [Tenacibaculum caenipelagi]|nr:helix-turn-helix domain-containing protein [Tenacibaculum caenipelagi]
MLTGKYYLADILNNEAIYLNFCDSLINLTKNYPTKNYPSILHYKKSTFYIHKGENSKALKEITQGKQTLIKNDSLKHLLLIQLALIESSIGELEKALTHYKKAYFFAKQKKYFKLKHGRFSTLPLNIASVYNKLNKDDSAYFYINEGIELYKEIKDSLSLGYSLYMLGRLEAKRKNYEESIKSYKKSIPTIINDENYKILIGIYIKVAILYDSINSPQESLKFHLKADSLYSLRKFHAPMLEKTYSHLYKLNKKSNNLKKQLLYLNKLLEVKEFKLKEKSKISKTLSEKYDIPNLLSEKKKIIKKLETEVLKSRRNRIIYISLLVLSLALIGNQIKRKRTFKKRFLSLVNQKEPTVERETQTIIQTTNKHELSDKTVDIIMRGLEAFEKNTDFLNSKINLQLLADRLETNTSYLSKVINQYKKNSFSNYINQLRIEYTVEKLKNDTLWRKYTIKALANEVGFKNSESFSKAFYKFTGIKPSYFIKELDKVETD